MSKRPFTSLIPPEMPIPDPPQLGWVKKAGIGCFIVVMFLMIGFIFVDFSFEMFGHPLNFGVQDPVLPPLEKNNTIRTRDAAVNVKNVLEQTVLLSPVKQCRIKSKNAEGGIIPFICVWETDRGAKDEQPPFPLHLFADNLPVEWDAQFGKTTLFAAVKLPPGLHRLSTAVHETEVFVEGGTPSEKQGLQTVKYPGWQEFCFHSGIDNIVRCGECHNEKKDTDILNSKGHFPPIGDWKGGKHCADCHKEFDFQKVHRHPLEVYNDCRKCHIVHGTASGQDHLLRDSRAVLCTQCHERRIKL